MIRYNLQYQVNLDNHNFTNHSSMHIYFIFGDRFVYISSITPKKSSEKTWINGIIRLKSRGYFIVFNMIEEKSVKNKLDSKLVLF